MRTTLTSFCLSFNIVPQFRERFIQVYCCKVCCHGQRRDGETGEVGVFLRGSYWVIGAASEENSESAACMFGLINKTLACEGELFPARRLQIASGLRALSRRVVGVVVCRQQQSPRLESESFDRYADHDESREHRTMYVDT